MKARKLIYDLYLENTGFINNWDIVDISISNIVGAHLYEKDKTPLYDLVQSKILWELRNFIIATFYFIKQNEFNDTLKNCENFA